MIRKKRIWWYITSKSIMLKYQNFNINKDSERLDDLNVNLLDFGGILRNFL